MLLNHKQLLKMAKLQLYITKSTSGFKSVYNINPSEDVRSLIGDVRSAVSQIDYDSSEKNIFYMLKPTAEGVFVGILRTIPPRAGDHLAAWIYVPGNIVVGADDLERVVRLTTRKVSGSEVTNDDIVALREAFSADYVTDYNQPLLTGSNPAGGYAWRLYGGDEAPSLHEFMGRGLWQQDYLPFAGVLLIDEELGVTATGEDLTDKPLLPAAAILPPEDADDGFKPYVFGRLLDRPIRAGLGGEITVVWKRSGFEDVSRTQKVSSPEFVPASVSTGDSRKIITPQSFSITSQFSHQAVNDCQIRVNGYEIPAEGRSFTRSELASASVVVTADGYFPYSGHIDLASTTRALIQMQERRKIYIFELPVKSSELGAPIKFEIHSKRALTDSPLEGYRLLDDIVEGSTRVNHLGFVGSPLGSLAQRAIYVAAGLVVGVLLCLCFTKCGGSSPSTATTGAVTTDSAQVTDAQAAEIPVADAPESAPVTQPATVNTSLTTADAIKYLDGSKKWNRTDMEKNANLTGLFDDMNNFRIERLINYWGPKLSGSKNFAYVLDHAVKSQSKKVALSGKYNKKADDTVISVVGYVNRIDP